MPGGRITFEPRWAIRLVTRANAFRPVSVKSIVTIGCWLLSKFCSGFLTWSPESSESSSITNSRWIDFGWLGTGSASTTTMPCGTSITLLPARGPPAPSAFSSVAQAVPFAYLCAAPGLGS